MFWPFHRMIETPKLEMKPRGFHMFSLCFKPTTTRAALEIRTLLGAPSYVSRRSSWIYLGPILLRCCRALNWNPLWPPSDAACVRSFNGSAPCCPKGDLEVKGSGTSLFWTHSFHIECMKMGKKQEVGEVWFLEGDVRHTTSLPVSTEAAGG